MWTGDLFRSMCRCVCLGALHMVLDMLFIIGLIDTVSVLLRHEAAGNCACCRQIGNEKRGWLALLQFLMARFRNSSIIHKSHVIGRHKPVVSDKRARSFQAGLVTVRLRLYFPDDRSTHYVYCKGKAWFFAKKARAEGSDSNGSSKK